MSEATSVLGTLVQAMLEGIRDGRVARVVQGKLMPDLQAALEEGFVDRFLERLGEDADEFGEFPDEVVHSVDDAFSWVADERPQFRDQASEAVALIVGGFIDKKRDEILEAMRQAGEGPDGDRAGRMAKVEAAMADLALGRKALDDLPARAEAASLDAILEPAVVLFEKARDLLEEVALDDGILGVPEGALSARDRIRDVWMAEVELYLAAVDKFGRPLDKSDVVTFEQQPYLLDAIVALQEALTLRIEAADLLRLARLRMAKGDIGEARALVVRIREMDPDQGLLDEAASLDERLSASSPLSSDKRCFIATAAAGEQALEVQTLRAWRDKVLAGSRAGRSAISVYYRFSPPIAGMIKDSRIARKTVRSLVVVPMARLANIWMNRLPH
jgi:tetratricopeptide (TPR) repeat protein